MENSVFRSGFRRIVGTCFVFILAVLFHSSAQAQAEGFWDSDQMTNGSNLVLQMLDSPSLEAYEATIQEMMDSCSNYDPNTRVVIYSYAARRCAYFDDCPRWNDILNQVDTAGLYPGVKGVYLVGKSSVAFSSYDFQGCREAIDSYLAEIPEYLQDCEDMLSLASLCLSLGYMDPMHKECPPQFDDLDIRVSNECPEYEETPIYLAYLLERANSLYIAGKLTNAADFMQRGFSKVHLFTGASEYYAFMRIYTDVLRQVGMTDEALANTEEIDWSRALLTSLDSLNYALARNNYAVLKLEDHGIREALDMCLETERIILAIDSNHYGLPSLLSNIGLFYNQTWNVEMGLKYLDRSIEKFRVTMDQLDPATSAAFLPGLILAHINRASILLQLVDDRAAAQSSIKFLEDNEKSFNSMASANMALLRSLLSMRDGDMTQALDYAQQSVDLFDRMDAAGYAKLPATEQLAMLQVINKNFEAGIRMYDGLIEFYEGFEDWDGVVVIMLMKASAYGSMNNTQAQKDIFEGAEKIMLENTGSSFRVSNMVATRFLDEKTDLLMSQGDYEAALKASEELLKLATEGNRPDSYVYQMKLRHGVILLRNEELKDGFALINYVVENSQNDDLIWIDAARTLAYCKFELKEYDEALALTLEVKERMISSQLNNGSRWGSLLSDLGEYYQMTGDYVESVEAFMESRMIDRTYFEQQAMASRDYLDARFLDQNADEELYYSWYKSDFHKPDEVLEYRLWAKSFIERTASSNARRANLISRANQRAQQLQSEIRRATTGKDSLERELEEVQAVMNRLLNQVASDISAQDIASSLLSHECIVDLVQHSNNEEQGFFACIYLPTGEVKTIPVMESFDDDFAEDAQAFMFPEDKKVNMKTAARLYEEIWAPVDPHVQGYREIYWATSGILVNLSPALMYDEKNREFLMDRYEFSIAADVADLNSDKTDLLATEGAVLIGNPKFGGSINESQIGLDFLQRAGEMGSWIDLDGTGIELNVVDSLVSSWISTSTLTQTAATEDAFLGLQSPKYLHIATHGFFMEEEADPYNACGLVMNGANESIKSYAPVAADNYVTAGEIMNMDLSSTSLVVLSACESAQGVSGQSENYNLVRAFKIAGARSVIASGWSVSDKKTVYFMTQFYDQMAKGLEAKKAFVIAQHRMREKYDDPYVWGVFKFFE